MDLSTKHRDARIAASRIPALSASLALLERENPNPARIDFYSAPVPTPGAAPAGARVVSIPLDHAAGIVDTDLVQIRLTVPLEAQIDGANPSTGTTVTWARIVDGDGDWFADCSVSDGAGAGEIKLQTTLLYDGAYCRLTSAIVQG